MRSVAWLVRQRLARRWRSWIVMGVLLGVGFGLALAAFNTARRTTSAYDRVLDESDAPDASLFHFLTPDEAEAASADLLGVVARRHLVGFFGEVRGIDPALTRAMVAGTGPRFVVERPHLREGRLPARDRPDEVFVNQFLADRAGVRVGDRLDLRLFAPPDFTAATPAPVTVVGIGPFPRDAVVDETAGAGVMVFSEAFADRHRHLQEYGATNVDLAPGVDPRGDLAAAVGALGFQLQEVRDQEEQAVDDALRPLVAILLGLGTLVFAATAIAAAQVMQRDQERTRPDDEHLQHLGMVRRDVVLALLVPASVVAVVAVAVAIVVMAAMSPLAPAGPLRELDPERGIVVDASIASAGALVIVVTVVGIAGLLAIRRRSAERLGDRRPRLPAWLPPRPTLRAGLALSSGGRDRRRRARRTAGFATVAVILATLVVTLVSSAVALSETPARYGFAWDLIAVTVDGDQTRDGLDGAFADDADVAAATGFSSWSVLLDGRAVPALAATPIKGELGPTTLRGRPLRADDEVLVGRDTLERLGLEIGDQVEIVAPQYDGSSSGEPTSFRIVGVATFPPVSQIGADQPRLGTGALLTRRALDRLIGSDANDPDWTAVRVTDGASAGAVIAQLPDGIPDATGAPTSWYTDAKPAELRQLDEVRALLYGAIAITALIALAVVIVGLWSQTRANRRDLAMLGALGFTRRQRGATAAWQAAPLAVVVLVVGVPLGLALGRWTFSVFARSLAVDDQASFPPAVVIGLVVGTVVALAVGAAVAASVARRLQLVPYLRAE